MAGVILLGISAACKSVNFANFASIGQCFLANAFFGDPVLMAIVVAILFLGLMLTYNFPTALLLPFTVVLSYMLWLLSGSATNSIFFGMLILSLMVNGAILVLGIVGAVNK